MKYQGPPASLLSQNPANPTEPTEAQLKDPKNGETVAANAYIDWRNVALIRDKIIKDIQQWSKDHPNN